jgi:Ca-activated chloride channel family protein
MRPGGSFVPKRHGRAAISLLMAVLVVGAAAAQTPAPPKAVFEEQLEVAWVLVPVVVRSPEGYVKGLDAKDFRLFVDDRPVAIGSFETGAQAPVSLVHLQDLSGSMGTAGKLEASRAALEYLLEQARPGDEFAVASFAGDQVQVEVPFTAELDAVREAATAWEAYGTTALHDAVAWLPRIHTGSASLKRAAVLITDGVDNASSFRPPQARDIVRRAELPVYVLGMGTGSPYRLDAGGDKIYRFADVLNLLAHQTGGQYHPIDGPDDLKEACAAIAEDLRHQYVLGFSTAGNRPRYRRLRVQVDGRGRRTLSFRRGYQGGPPLGSAG